MASILKKACAGTMESSDVYVEIEPCENTDIHIESVVSCQFGESIEKTVREVLSDLSVGGARLFITDRGALDCVIRARVETAVRRGMG